MIRQLKKFISLEGIVAIILSIFCLQSFLSCHYLSAILLGIFAYWMIQRVLQKTAIYKIKIHENKTNRIDNLDI